MSDTGITSLVDAVIDAFDNVDKSLPSMSQANRRTQVLPMAYIDESIVDEPIMPMVMGALNQLYISYVVASLNLHTVISSGNTVHDVLRTVATESYMDVLDVVGEFGEDTVVEGLESISVVDLAKKEQSLTTGKLIQIDLVTGSGKDANAVEGKGKKEHDVKKSLHVLVQIRPNIVSRAVAEGFISLNFTAPATRRWRMVKAGEIKFWRDFVLSKDLLDQYTKSLRDDRTGVLGKMMDRKNNNLLKAVFYGFSKKPPRNNLASSIIIFSSDTFDEQCHKSGLDFSKYTERQKFFWESFSMVVAVINPDYNVVDMYFNGIQEKATYTFAMVEEATKKTSYDLKDIMNTFGSGMAPKF